MSSSPETVPVTPLAMPELRTGTWTRFGTDAVLGDAVTEATLGALAESTRAAARSQGYSVGWAEGQRAARELARTEAAEAAERERRAEELRDAEHRAALEALTHAARRLTERAEEVCSAIEEQASTLAWELVTELLGRELTSATGPDVVRRVLRLLPAEPLVAVRLHPADVAGADELRAAGLTVLADPTLERGDALVEAEDHVLDLRIGTALARVREVLA